MRPVSPALLIDIGWTLVTLAPFASFPDQSRGRLFAEMSSPTRSEFQRDRDRIIHSNAFRRLKHKTQVFLYHEGDHFRTRLTHTIEVAQVARSLARGLKLNEDLAEALALAHDLGHPPFGHTGEDALNVVMAKWGGFDHNAQSLRIVTDLERRYAQFDGLNLTWETLEGLIKHNGPAIDPSAGDDDQGRIPRTILAYNARHDLWLDTHASAEAQVAAIADDIAYDSHDIDDALRAGLLTLNDLQTLPIASEALREVRDKHPGLDDDRTIHEVLRRVLTWLIEDVFAETERRLSMHSFQSSDEVRRASGALIAFSQDMAKREGRLKAELFTRVYRHPRIMDLRKDAEQVVDELFQQYRTEPDTLPKGVKITVDPADEARFARFICDFIAGMTDRFALQEHTRLFAKTPQLR